MIKWDQGRDKVQLLLDQGRLTPVHPSRETSLRITSRPPDSDSRQLTLSARSTHQAHSS